LNGALHLSNLIQLLYKKALQPFLFGLDAENAHNVAVQGLKFFEKIPGAFDLFGSQFVVRDPRLEVTVRSMVCPNPVGLAAGFDKGAELFQILPSLGFGFLELGTITPKPQEDHLKPRVFRSKARQALVNRMGFNNPGLEVVRRRLLKGKSERPVPIGINIGKGFQTPLEEAHKDYLHCFENSYPLADYFVLNVSSPNTPNLRALQEMEPIRKILKLISAKAKSLAGSAGEAPKPVFVKVAPDNSGETLEEIVRTAVEFNVGIVATNTTTELSLLGPKWANEKGGLSGKPLKEKADAVLRRVYRISRGAIPIIGVGGVFSAEDAYEKIRLGASLVQVYTGWIYEGPNLIPAINRGLLKLMQRDGFARLQDAVGTA